MMPTDWINAMVSSVFTTALTRSGLKIHDLLAWLGRWWLSEFLAFFPEPLSEWLTDRGYKKLTVLATPEFFVIRLLSDRNRLLAKVRVDRSLYSPMSIDDFLKTHKLDRKGVVVGVQLPEDQIFSRRLILPLETAGSIDGIVVQDLIAKTPFRLADIFHDHTYRRLDGKVTVWQWIARREFVADAARSAGLDLTELAFVESEGGSVDGGPPPLLTLGQERRERRSRLPKAFCGLALLALSLMIVNGTHKYWRQQGMLDNLSAELTTARERARQVRLVIDKLDQKQAAIVRLRSQKRDVPGLLEIWEEISRLLPADSWLTELRLSEAGPKSDHLVVMTGLSTAAADLVALIDKSPLFVDAALTAPIAVDATEQRERFTLQARLLSKSRIEKPAP